LNVLWPRSTEHEGLTIGPDLADNLADLRLETHVQHAVGLVHDQVCDSTKIGFLRFEHVDQATGGGDNDLDPALQIANLRTFGSPAIDGSIANPRVGTGWARSMEKPDDDKLRRTQIWCTPAGSGQQALAWGQGQVQWDHLQGKVEVA
jgi:hypothetical protein